MGSKSRVAAGSMKRSEESATKKRFVGVRQRPSGRWVAEIKDTTQKIRLWLGTFDSAEEGAKAYDSAARALRGANTRTNFVTALSSCETTSSKATRLIRLRQIAAANAKLQAEAGVRRDVNPQPTCSSNSDEDEQRHSQSLVISSPPPKLASRENAPSDSCLVDSEHIDPVFYEHLAASPPPSSPSPSPSPPSPPPPPLCCNSTSEVAVLASSAVSAFSCSSESSSLHSCASSSGASSSSSDDPLDACIPWSDYVLVDGLDHLPLYASMAFDFSAEAMERDSCSTSLLEDHTSASLRDSDEFPHFNVAMSTSETSSDLDRHVDDAEICSTSHDLVSWSSRSFRGRRHAAT